MFTKICGITCVEDALAAVELGADAIGLNFYPRSPRYVAQEVAQRIAESVRDSVQIVGVFVDVSRDQIESVAAFVGLDVLQFHGDESVAFCSNWNRRTIKALRIRDTSTAQRASEYRVDFILADAYVEGHFGGTGSRVAVEYLQGLDRSRLILAGGLTAENVAESVRLVGPFGVDVASGVESAPGKKDRERMRRFIENARAA